ncbi:nitrogen fixation protein FixH [Novosphingobium kunmingense]|uniref:Nitrogen fixation protein FixH n=1 Tax=Novosphingobium kunmingense TaxID=1211806 RepID=A0A2N0I2U5_9SPHN|nr:FixH family protein [Novosphingobium kunmingense]PKB25516.1 nitrogen fixation protein FixH [Novosphingobium kunmingense]
MTRRFNGRHMALILVGGFGLVIAVNLSAAVVAKRTFGGIVVENSYAASQDFNRWLNEAKSERALGWNAQVSRRPDGRLALALGKVPAGAVITAEARHPLGRAPDRVLTFAPDGPNGAVSREMLPAGRWTLRMTISAEGRQVRSESALR